MPNNGTSIIGGGVKKRLVRRNGKQWKLTEAHCSGYWSRNTAVDPLHGFWRHIQQAYFCTLFFKESDNECLVRRDQLTIKRCVQQAKEIPCQVSSDPCGESHASCNKRRVQQLYLSEYPRSDPKIINVKMRLVYASVAQLVERGTENPCVAGSIPAGGTKRQLLQNIRHRAPTR